MLLPEQERVESFFAGLGSTANEVAATLEQRGFSGVRRDPECCPINDALTKTFPVPGYEWSTCIYFVGIGPTDAWTVANDWLDAEVMNVSLPDPMRQFVDLFDKGFYPGLERRIP